MKNIKGLLKAFIKKSGLTGTAYSELKKAADTLGYTVIEFNSHINDKDVDTVIHNLKLTDHIAKSKGFTYADSEYRLMFINEALNDEEKQLVIAHELGHIACEHFSKSPVIGNDVKEEHEANEFAHYLLKKRSGNSKKFSATYRRILISTIILLCLSVGAAITYLLIQNQSIYKDGLYVTSTGKCYHRSECIFVKNKTNSEKLTKADFESGIYSPCDICLPNAK